MSLKIIERKRNGLNVVNCFFYSGEYVFKYVFKFVSLISLLFEIEFKIYIN